MSGPPDPTLSVTVAVYGFPPPQSYEITYDVLAETAVGVPLITPVEESKLKPSGRSGEIVMSATHGIVSTSMADVDRPTPTFASTAWVLGVSIGEAEEIPIEIVAVAVEIPSLAVTV